jgi:hypothetical protein
VFVGGTEVAVAGTAVGSGTFVGGTAVAVFVGNPVSVGIAVAVAGRSAKLATVVSSETAAHIESDDTHLLFLADVALHPIHVTHPKWVNWMDVDPAQTVCSRKHCSSGSEPRRADLGPLLSALS